MEDYYDSRGMADIDDEVDYLLGQTEQLLSGMPTSGMAPRYDPHQASAGNPNSVRAAAPVPSFEANAAKLLTSAGYGGSSNPRRYSNSDAAEEYQHATGHLQAAGSPTSEGGSPIPAYDRICRWTAKKAAKLASLRQAREEETFKECTFSPNMSVGLDSSRAHSASAPEPDLGPSSLYEGNKCWGYDAFVSRYLTARQRKEEERQYVENYWANETRWTSEPTVPKSFELGRPAKHGTIKALERTYDSLASKVRHQHQHDPSEIEGVAVPSGIFSFKATSAILEHSPNRRRRAPHAELGSNRTGTSPFHY